MLKNILYGNIGGVDRILANLQRSIDELKNLAINCEAEATEVATKISGLRARHSELRAESERASRVASFFATNIK